MSPTEHLKDGGPMGMAQSEGNEPTKSGILFSKNIGEGIGQCLGRVYRNPEADAAACVQRAIDEIRRDAAQMSELHAKKVAEPDPSKAVRALAVIGIIAIALSATIAFCLLMNARAPVPEAPAPERAAPSTKGRSIFVLRDGTIVIDPASKK